MVCSSRCRVHTKGYYYRHLSVQGSSRQSNVSEDDDKVVICRESSPPNLGLQNQRRQFQADSVLSRISMFCGAVLPQDVKDRPHAARVELLLLLQVPCTL